MKYLRKMLATLAVAGALTVGIAAPAVAVELVSASPVVAAEALAGSPHAQLVLAVADSSIVNDWVIPAIPPVLLLVLNFVSPYFVSLLNALTKAVSANVKRVIAVIVSFVLSGGVIGVAIWAGWVPLDNSPNGIITLVALGLVLQQTAYERFLKESANALAERAGAPQS
ncbi:MAG: hypothetical protein AB7T06_24785 [Kofleriaceae bacterium]